MPAVRRGQACNALPRPRGWQDARPGGRRLMVQESHAESQMGRRRMSPADRIFRNGKVITVDRDFSICSAIAVTGDRIVATGTDAEVLTRAGEGTEVIDLAGR